MHPIDHPFLEALLATASEGVVVHDGAGTIVFCNEAARRILDLDEQLVGKNSHGLESRTVREDGSPFPAAEHPAMVTLRTGAPCRNVVMGLRHGADPPHCWISINSAVIPGDTSAPAHAFAVFTDITAHIEANERLRLKADLLQVANRALMESETYLRSILRAIPDAMWLKDPGGKYRLCNAEFESMFGVAEGEIVGHSDFDFVDTSDATLFRAADRFAIATNSVISADRWLTNHATGQRVLVETVKTPIFDSDGELLGVLGLARDITERQLAAARIAALMDYQRAVLLNAPIGISVCSPSRICREVNPAFARIFGISQQAMIGQSTRMLYRDDAQFLETGSRAWPIVRDGGTFAEDVPMRHRSGADIWVHQVAHLIDAGDPERGVVLIMDDVTDRRFLQETLQHYTVELEKLSTELHALARTDPLTGLANRRAFMEAADIEFSRARRFGSDTSLLVMDVDHFKQINDVRGHAAGDRALMELGAVLRSMTRTSDLVARLGGEEFVMLLASTDLAGALVLAERVRATIAETAIMTDDARFSITVSIGVAQVMGADTEWPQALSRADGAMYRAKEAGRNRVEAYLPHEDCLQTSGEA